MMALTLQLRARTIKWNTLTLTRTHRFFSTSNSDDGGPDSKPNSPFSSYFSDVKERLKKNPPTSTPPLRTSPTFSHPNRNPNPNPRPSSVDFEEIRKNLSEFRRRTTAPPPGADSSSEPILFQEIYNRNVPDSNSARNAGGGPSFDAIRQSMQKLRPSVAKQGSDPMSLPAFRKTLKWGPSSDSGSSVIGGTGEIPTEVFGKEMREKKDPAAAAAAMSTEFVKMYSYSELGKKLRMLRPEGGGREWFSLGELNERLVRLREMEEEESLSTVTGVVYRDLRQSLERLQQSNEDKAKKTSLQKLDILGHLGRTPSSMLDPPQEHLVERYFHPDNMSSAEKLKIELAKVRDEFKMSESDCGSARVQVAQLTTKIKHLSSVLHKKDKHSRKGLLAMVQRRKRLLKYLRSTDWDSYCFVISKLGLRDNPDLKY